MAGKYERKKLIDCPLDDPFFDSLKNDYPEFEEWYISKAQLGEEAFVFEDDYGLCAFIYFKDYENQEIKLKDRILPKKNRLKIRTFKLDFRHQGRRLGEGAMGIALWKWQDSGLDEIYLTVYENHTDLIKLIEKYGFVCVGELEKDNPDEVKKELVYIKSRKNLDYSTPHKAFPFINPNIDRVGVLPMHDYYHDRLLPYSELKNTNQEFWDEAAGNGITKVYIGFPMDTGCFKDGEVVFFYRKYTGNGPKTYKSCMTSYGTITKVIVVKSNNIPLKSNDDFKNICSNKTIFSRENLDEFYKTQKNIVVIEFIYNGFFGKGNNITHNSLNQRGLFETYPYQIKYTEEQFKEILSLGGKNVQNIIVDSSRIC